MISYTIKFHSKKIQNSCILGEFYFKFYMKCLNCQTEQAFLTGWHLFTFFTVAPFLCTPSIILDFCSILVASNTVIWASLFGAHRSKLEVKDNFKSSPEKLSRLWHGNSCFAFRIKFSGFIFFLILFWCSA